MVTRKAERRYCHSNRSKMALVKPCKSISQLESERAKRDNFAKGCNYAAALLCGMFAFLAFGAVMWGW
jgi:hypothetical protein